MEEIFNNLFKCCEGKGYELSGLDEESGFIFPQKSLGTFLEVFKI